MSQPIKRYRIECFPAGWRKAHPEGEWVDYSDYAALAAENERLRKAGDAMYDAAVQDSTGLWVLKPFQDWKAAKEGRDAK